MAATMTASRRRGRFPLPEGMTPFDAVRLKRGWRKEMPDVIEFVTSDRYLDRGQILYPRQATILKIIFLQDELFTDYDHEVIGGWIESYERTADEKGEGNNGIVPDIYERIRICKEEGRPWFRENVIVIGRRGSKGHIGGLAGSYVLWNYMGFGDPQTHFNVDRSKKLAFQVFAGKKDQARANQWRDLAAVILGAPCFTGSFGPSFISRAQGESLSVFAPSDFYRMYEAWERGVTSTDDPATFLIEPKESTVMSSRGPASCAQFYDEMAHVVRSVARSDAGEVYESATPALDQFGVYGFLYEPSSPWQKIGKFYENYQKALEHDPDGAIAYPEVMMLQLTSWDPYVDWERANQIPLYPGGLHFRRLNGPIQAYDDNMQRLEKANPETFKVERRSHWAAVMDAYLNPEKIAGIWAPWPEEAPVNVDLMPQSERTSASAHRGRLDLNYRAHGDPSKSGANFGWSIAHIAGFDERGLPHVVFDKIHAWVPGDYEANNFEVDYDEIGNDIAHDLDLFMPTEASFDQFNSVNTIQRLNRHVRARKYPKRVTVYERTANGPLNWKTYETFKTAVNLGLIHAPFHELADLELQFLQDIGHEKVDHPTSGPVQTKDVADTMAIVTYELIGEQIVAFLGQTLSDLPLGGVAPGGITPFGNAMAPEEAHDALSGLGRGGRARGGGRGAPRRPRGPRGY